MSAGKWIRFDKQPTPTNQKTEVWHVVSSADGVWPDVIGVVKWYPPWRRYAFFPEANTLYEHQCLRDLAEFCNNATVSRREARKAERAEA